jgi:hypothetical protein
VAPRARLTETDAQWTRQGFREYYRDPPRRAPVAQLDRVSASEEVKQRFETGGKINEISTFEMPVYPRICGVTRQ